MDSETLHGSLRKLTFYLSFVCLFSRQTERSVPSLTQQQFEAVSRLKAQNKGVSRVIRLTINVSDDLKP